MSCLSWLASLEQRGNVVVVAGPPLSGKTTLARTHLLKGDKVIDLDYIHAEITGLPLYHRNKEAVGAALDIFKRRAFSLKQGWIIRTAAEPALRANLRTYKHARVIVLEVHPQVCKSRLDQRPYAVRKELSRAIDEWWSRYQRDSQDAVLSAVRPQPSRWLLA